MERWTETAQIALERAARAGSSLTEIAAEVRRATRGRFAPHSTTCLRKLRALGYKRSADGWSRASTRVDTPRRSVDPETLPPRMTVAEYVRDIPSRVRAPLSARLPPPGVLVLTFPLSEVDARPDGLAGALRGLLSSLPPGWEWSQDPEAVGDAVACARHQATRRGATLEEVERPDGTAVVAVREARAERADLRVLAVVRFSRPA